MSDQKPMVTCRSIFREQLFGDQVVLVTGGGSGIGRCTSRELAALGACVVVAGRTRGKLEDTVSTVTQEGGTADLRVCDIREEDQVTQMIASILDGHGRLDGVVNNAGGQFPSPLRDLSKRGWEAVVRNNLTGTFLVSREAVVQHFADHGGSIVNIVAEIRNGMPLLGHTGASRAGVVNLTRTAALEWGQYGVRVNSVAPGIVDSEGLETYTPEFVTVLDQARQRMPLKRFATESEVSSAILYLLSPAASYITGSMVQVDGGSFLCGPIVPLTDYPPPIAGFHAFATC